MPVTSRDANVPSHPKAYAALHSLLITNSADYPSATHVRKSFILPTNCGRSTKKAPSR